MGLSARIRDVAVCVPDFHQTVAEIEDHIRLRNPGIALQQGLLERAYGMARRTVAPHDQLPSDLAVQAARRVLDRSGTRTDEVDLLIFAGVCEDFEEPATAHVVAERLGVRAPVMDVKNACNGVLNALEIADAFIRCGRYDRVLVTTGELNTRYARWEMPTGSGFATALPSHSGGDLGAALLVEASTEPGILGSRFLSHSEFWPAAVLTNPYMHHGRLGAMEIDSELLFSSTVGVESHLVAALEEIGVKVGDLSLACLHQPSLPFAQRMCDRLGIPREAMVETFPEHGNVATATIPLQLALAEERGILRRGDTVGLFGFASGVGFGVMALQW